MLVELYWRQRENKEKTHTLSYFQQKTKETLFNYSTWLMNILKKFSYCVAVNKYAGKTFTS